MLIICITCRSCLGNQSAPRACLSGTANALTGQDSDSACLVSTYPIVKKCLLYVSIRTYSIIMHTCVFVLYRNVLLEHMPAIQHPHFVRTVLMALLAQTPVLCFLYPAVVASMQLAMGVVVQ